MNVEGDIDMQLDPKIRNILIAVGTATAVLAILVVIWARSGSSEPGTAVAVAPEQSTQSNGASDGATATEVSETSPVQAVSAALTQSDCINNSEFIADVTLPDGSEVAPGQQVAKTWRVKNSGTCAWSETYQLVFAGGDQLNGPASMPLGVVVEPGTELDMTVTLAVPADAGQYQGQWIPADAAGVPFGHVVNYDILVPGTPAIAYFVANGYWVQPGEEVTLSWDLSEAYDGAFLRVNGTESGVVAPGSALVAPSETTRYELIARNAQGESMRHLTVMVAPPSAEPLPVIEYFKADRVDILLGEQVALGWSLTGATNGAFLVVDGEEEGIVSPDVKTVSPETTTAYRLVARNGSGESVQEITINVTAPDAATPDATEIPATPTTAVEEAPTATPESAEPTTEPTEAAPAATEPPAEEAAPEATAVPVEEATAAPAEEATAAPAEEPAATALQSDTALLESPDQAAIPVTSVGEGQTMTALGRTEDGSWIQVKVAGGAQGWVAADAVSLSVDATTLPVTGTP